MSLFPGAIASFLGFTAGDTLKNDQHAAQHNSEQAEIVATQTKIGTGVSTPTSGLVLRGSGAGTSAWSQAILTSDVSGVLPTANGGSGNANLSFPSGTETVVGRNTTDTLVNKTLTTPTIASFVNALHDHTNSAGGGPLGASTVGSSQIVDNSIAFGDLLSTIFSGQVLTQVNAGTGGGTMSYINLGGIKLLWAAITGASGSTTYGVTFPNGFFTTTPIVVQGATGSAGTTTGQYIVGTQVSSTAFNWYSGTNPTTGTNFIAIGT